MIHSNPAKSVLDFADSLPGPYGYESSIKLSRNKVSDRRFLVTFPSVALDMGANLSALLQRLHCPVQAPIDQLIKGRSILHLGVEESDNGTVCKLYAEDADRVRDLWQLDCLPTDENIPVHRALKWKLDSSWIVATDYDWLPCESRDQLIERSRAYLPEAIPLIEGLLELIPANCLIRNLQLLRVSEEENPRLSLDLNLYDAAMNVSALHALSKRLPAGDPYGALLGSAANSLGNIEDRILGHIALGTGREGESFITVYYGVQERGGFS